MDIQAPDLSRDVEHSLDGAEPAGTPGTPAVPAASARQLADVKRYYDDNTRAFAALGQGGTSIHRAVWGPGAGDRNGAIHFVDELILRELPATPSVPRVLDLGCGLGASLIYLARRRAIEGQGFTLSSVQAARAELEIRAAKLSNLLCREGNFLALPSDVRDFDLAFSIEAFIHSPSAAGYFEQVARALRPGGKLIVCDDFLAGAKVPAEHADALQAFRWGWRVGTLLSIGAAEEIAARAGLSLVRGLDLTGFLELNRPRDRLIRLLVKALPSAASRGEYWHSLVGGDALQRLLSSGVLQYAFLVFERRA